MPSPCSSGRSIVLAALLCCLAADPAIASMKLHFIDVGQGDATLVQFPCGNVLIDTGGERYPTEPWRPAELDSTERLVDYLRDALGDAGALKLLILTHPHKDHTRGVPAVLEHWPPEYIVTNGQYHGSGAEDQAAALRYAKENEDADSWYVLESKVGSDGLSNWVIDPFEEGALEGCETNPRIRVLWGRVRDDSDWSSGDFADENNHSVVVRIDYGRASAIWTGDLEETEREGEKAGIERLLEKFAGTDLLDVDVYQAGHHASHNGTSDGLVEAISPEIAVISAGPACEREGYSAWQHAHPRTETIRELEAVVSEQRIDAPKRALVFERWNRDPVAWPIRKAIYSTGWDGDIVLEGTADGDWSVELGTPDPCLAE